jgi:23S rRNA pseudouridine2605 synthase
MPPGFRLNAEAFFVGGPRRSGLGQAAARGKLGADGPEQNTMSDDIQVAASEVRSGQRIAKVMARAGVCSRREAEAWISEGRVRVNGEVLTSPAFNVSETDNVQVDGKPLAAAERTRLFLFHKPRGLVTTARDPEGRNTVFAVLPPDLPRVVAIGRLDINTEGLLLLTNDGGLSRVLELPSTGWLRRYRVRAHGTVDQAALDRLSEGVTIDGVDYMGVEAKLDREQGSNAWLTLGLREGKNREIKKILEHLGLAVNRLIRVSFGPFELGDLPEGEVMEVRTRVIRDQLGLKLAKQAGVNFDVPEIAVEPPPERRQVERPQSKRGAGETYKPRRATPGRPDRGASGEEKQFERDAAPRRARLTPSTPERRRKHVSALRAEIAADAATTRKRVERSATQDRKGRTIAVERMSRTGDDAQTGAAPEARPQRPGRPNAGERGGRSFEGRARAGRSESFGPKRGRAAARDERPPRSDHTERRGRPERPSAAGGESGPRERRFDRPLARSDGERRDGPPRSRSAGDPARERKFERPPGRSRPPASEGRSPRSDDAGHGARPDFKSRPPRAGARDAERPHSRVRDTGGDGAPPRERRFDRPPGRSRPPASEGRTPRSDDRSGPRSDFKSRPQRAGARDGDRPQSRVRDTSGGGAPPRERRFDRPDAKPDGARRDEPPRTRGAGDPARERKFDRPQGRTRPPSGEGRPPRSEDKSRGPRSDFKSRPPRTGSRDGDRPQSRGAGGKGGPQRGRPSPGGRPPPRKGPPKGASGPRRPPRKP